MRKRFVSALSCVFVLSLLGLAQSNKPAPKKVVPSDSGLDRVMLQTVLDGWSTLDPADAAKFYAHGPGTFFDVAPLKYSSWEEYEAGVRKVLVDYQSIKFTLNDDAAVHVHGDVAWATSTIKKDAVLKGGKREMATLRWTAIWEKRDGKWVIVHDHTSEPLQ